MQNAVTAGRKKRCMVLPVDSSLSFASKFSKLIPLLGDSKERGFKLFKR
jgi:hypothetical protein